MPLHGRKNNKTETGAKRRWTTDDRAKRDSPARIGRKGTPSSPRRPDAAAASRAERRSAQFGEPRRDDAQQSSDGRRSEDRRTDWYPGGRGTQRRDAQPARDDRGARPARNWEERPARGDRPTRSYDDRPARTERPSYGDRPARSYSDRPARTDRPARDDRQPRSYSDRPARDDRAPRTDRPNRDDRAPRTFDRNDRPARSYDDRPARSSSDRPERTERTERPARSYEGRPARNDRPARSYDDRPQRRTDHFGDNAARRDNRDQTGAAYVAPQDVVLERIQADTVTAADVSNLTFADLGLGEQITRTLAELGAERPFPIQSATIPDALAGRNVLGRGRTGSGKTIAFGAALVERLMRNWAEQGRTGTGREMGRAPRALILAPTRELALQIDRTIQPIARSVGLFTTQIVGGVPQARQVGALKKGVDIVIGTPGRIEDLIEQGRLDLRKIEVTVLDEADHMAELGFLEPMQRILSLVPANGQRLLFSATLDAAVAGLVQRFLPNAAAHEVAEEVGGTMAKHHVLVIEQGEKLHVLSELIASTERSLVFARTRAFAEQLADELEDEGVRTSSLHGDLNQSRRSRNLERFSSGRADALVATDVAARGIHVDGIGLVIHADAAEDYKTYLHRSGRTGRAGASGTVVTLITARRRLRFEELLERAEIDATFTTLRVGGDAVAAIAE